VVLNAILAPVLISGWLTGVPLGLAGAGLATTISIVVAVVMMVAYFLRLEHYVGFDASLVRPRAAAWKRILAIGLPPGGEFALMFVYMGVIYWVIRGFGPEAQAGFGIGSRVMQAIFLPAMAIAWAVAPLAGQNVGARKHDRVRHTFRTAMGSLSALMVLLTLFLQWRPDVLVAFFSDEPEVIAAGADFLRIISWNFVASGIVFICSGMFQAIGHTVPALIASATRIVTFAVPAVWLSRQPWFELHHLWYTSVVTVFLQAAASWWMLSVEVRRKLSDDHMVAAPQPAFDATTAL
jgi:Na+-driven multidrug efflux pump